MRVKYRNLNVSIPSKSCLLATSSLSLSSSYVTLDFTIYSAGFYFIVEIMSLLFYVIIIIIIIICYVRIHYIYSASSISSKSCLLVTSSSLSSYLRNTSPYIMQVSILSKSCLIDLYFHA